MLQRDAKDWKVYLSMVLTLYVQFTNQPCSQYRVRTTMLFSVSLNTVTAQLLSRSSVPTVKRFSVTTLIRKLPPALPKMTRSSNASKKPRKSSLTP